MADEAHIWTDRRLEALERRMAAEYAHAASDMRVKLEKHLKAFNKEREMREKALDDTPEAKAAYKAWLSSQAADQARMKRMSEELAERAVRANEGAAASIANALPSVYAENANRAAYEIDRQIGRDTAYTLMSEDTARHLMESSTKDRPILKEVSKPKVDRPKDYRWNRQKFTSAITQGILQGESIPNIVKRTNAIFGSNRAAAVRAARTAVTASECAGRIRSYERAEGLGIPIVQEWMATLDERTREAHREADGQQVGVGEPFIVDGEELRYPGDPAGSPENVYSCRCTVRARAEMVKGEKGERWSRLPEGTTYEQWKKGKPVTRAESYMNEAGRVSADWFDNAASEAVSWAVTDASAQVWSSSGAEAYQHGSMLLANASEDVQSAWGAYESDLRLADAKTRNAHYSPLRGGVFMDMQADMTNTCGPMETFFHEFGHMIDNLAGRRSGGRKASFFSYERGLHKELGREINEHVDSRWKALKAEVKSDGFKEWHAAMSRGVPATADDVERAYRMGYISSSYRRSLVRSIGRGDQVTLQWSIPDLSHASAKQYAYAQLSAELRGMSDKAGSALSDMFEAATKGKAKGHWGHGKGYWAKSPANQATEGFAEFYSAMAIESETPEAMAVLREWLPDSAKLFGEILKEAAGL